MVDQREKEQDQPASRPLEQPGHLIESLHLKSTSEVYHQPAGRESEETSEDNVCPICKGAGFVHPRREDEDKPDYSRTVPCRCVRAKWEETKRQRLLSMCELPKKALKWTFETFEILPGLEEAYEAALELAERRCDTSWLLLMGGTDRGKSHLLAAICHRWLQQGIPARYAYVPRLFDELRQGFREAGVGSYEARFDFFLNVPLLGLDDLGTENRTPWVQERLDTIIDYRLMHELALVVTSNLPMEDLPFRIRSRLAREGRVIYVATEEYHTRPDRRVS